MKQSWPIALAALALGFALAWFAKPAPEPSPAAEAPAGRKIPREGLRPLVLAVRGDKPAAPGESAATESSEVRRRFDNAFKGISNRVDRTRILRIAEALGLNQTQHAAIESLLAKRRSDFAEASVDLETAPGKIAALEEEFEAAVLDLLDKNQIEALSRHRERALWNEAAALAHRDMAELSAQIDLSEEQHDKAFAAFLKSRAAHASAGRSSILGESFEQLAGAKVAVMDPALQEAFQGFGASSDPGDFQRRYAEAQRKINEAKLELLEPILTSAQLSQYHAALDSHVAMIGAPPEVPEPLPPPGPLPEEEYR